MQERTGAQATAAKWAILESRQSADAGANGRATLVSEHTEAGGSGHPELVMYCRSWCGHCALARTWLEERGVPYVEIDVDADTHARERAAGFNEGRLHTPTFECGAEVCVDFRPERLCDILGIEK